MACYRFNAMDARCCGLCYACGKNTVPEDQCNVCPAMVAAYFASGYFLTTCTSQGPNESALEHYCCGTVALLPIKLPLFFPCFLGACFNNAVNALCARSGPDAKNYLF